MKVAEFCGILNVIESVNFQLPNGDLVPTRFHVTEVGLIQKLFVDCGGTIRNETYANFQLWVASDLEHRLSPSKLKTIIDKSSELFQIGNLEIQIEYQLDTINKFGVEFNGTNFILTPKFTDCLAKDKCGISEEQFLTNVNEMTNVKGSCCTPGSGCC